MARDGTPEAAPPPDHRSKPTTPTELPPRSWRYTLRSAVAEFQRDQCTDLAAALTYYSVLALFPAVLALLSLLGIFGRGPRTADQILQLLNDLGQEQVAQQLEGPITSMVSTQGAGVIFILGIVIALFSASGYVGAFGRALNRIYEMPEGRPIWKLRPLMFVVTLGLVVIAALVLVGLVVSGPVARQLGGYVGLGDQTVQAWEIVKWPVILALVMVMVAVLYHVTPNVRQPKFRWLSPGAFVAILVWVAASIGFGFYVSNFSSYDRTYGSLAGIIVFLLWLWITNLALLLGGEVDAELERTRELEAGLPAEESIQLPPRDTTQIEKAREKREERVEQGRLLREHAEREGVTDDVDGYESIRGRRGQTHRGGGPAVTLDPLPSERSRQGAGEPH
jgi:membrane protein